MNDSPRKPTPTRHGIVLAMQEELEALLERLPEVQTFSRGAFTFWQGYLGNQEVCAIKSGVGKVNAAMSTQALIDYFTPEVLWVVGVAGALSPDLHIGDVLLGVEALQHDIDASALGFLPGEVPYDERSTYVADARLITCAQKVGGELFGARFKTGRVLSGDRFIAGSDEVRRLRERFAGDCVEMEGAAVAQVAQKNKLPFVIIRTISDRADGQAPQDFPRFLKEAAKDVALFIERLILSC
ncbi:MAG: 5'-methylthioadenosine/adenosylhomocysteine nucleosidase [Candidatus Carbobacillus altaicus]|nr:5'-methylthioadenosine/adenosylhomocysteine nucleosidase [Candidatus Carbobacillus altaicus]